MYDYTVQYLDCSEDNRLLSVMKECQKHEHTPNCMLLKKCNGIHPHKCVYVRTHARVSMSWKMVQAIFRNYRKCKNFGLVK